MDVTANQQIFEGWPKHGVPEEPSRPTETLSVPPGTSPMSHNKADISMYTHTHFLPRLAGNSHPSSDGFTYLKGALSLGGPGG